MLVRVTENANIVHMVSKNTADMGIVHIHRLKSYQFAPIEFAEKQIEDIEDMLRFILTISALSAAAFVIINSLNGGKTIAHGK